MTEPDAPMSSCDEATDLIGLELRRREAFRLVFGAAAAAAMLPSLSAMAGTPTQPVFAHGVASGDPLTTSVIIWTRITPVNPRRSIEVVWTVAANSDMTGVIATGNRVTNAARDFTVKVNASGLQPGTTYYYQFATVDGAVLSPIGTTRTLPAADSTASFSLLVFSCTNYEKGYFNAYAEAAKEPGIFGALHLGDYLYEYGPAGYITPALAAGVASEPRAAELSPKAEATTLDAYRLRHALYKTDPNLQSLHAAMPWITIYDDHESANDSWTGGAENHQPATEGPWKAREKAALQAYYEWMPLRDPVGRIYLDPVTDNPTGLYRSFVFGRVARLVMLDTRLAGRDEQLGTAALLAAYASPATADVVSGRFRSLMGSVQEQWVDDQLSKRGQTWQLIGNQTLCYYQNAPDYQNFPLFDAPTKAAISGALDSLFGAGAGALFASLGASGGPNPTSADSWTGYPTARARFNASLAKAKNPVVLSGDSHNAWAANLRSSGGQALGVEFGGASVTSPGLEQYFFQLPAAAVGGLATYSSATRSPTDKLVYADTSHRGYLRVDVSQTKLTTTYVTVDTVFSTGYTATRAKIFDVVPGEKHIAGT